MEGIRINGLRCGDRRGPDSENYLTHRNDHVPTGPGCSVFGAQSPARELFVSMINTFLLFGATGVDATRILG